METGRLVTVPIFWNNCLYPFVLFLSPLIAFVYSLPCLCRIFGFGLLVDILAEVKSKILQQSGNGFIRPLEHGRLAQVDRIHKEVLYIGNCSKRWHLKRAFNFFLRQAGMREGGTKDQFDFLFVVAKLVIGIY